MNFMKQDMAEELIDALGLVYVSDSEPGIRRVKKGKGFSYKFPSGELVSDAAERKRIASLGLPPAYDNVWICIQDNGHLQATGFDNRGRKQYRYHKDWQSFRSEQKFDQLVPFGQALPKIRRKVLRDLDSGRHDVHGVLAALTTLLDEAHLRVGNQAYVKENGTYGATTLLKRHIRMKEGRIELKFRAKGGKRVQRSLRHPRLQKILEEIADLPGRQLFVWRDDSGALKPVDSGRLNAYLAEVSGLPISAKTFRTWAGSVAAYSQARALVLSGEKLTVKQMAEASAEVLHNTPAISRSSYIHPAVIGLADKDVHPSPEDFEIQGPPLRGLRAEENRLLDFLVRLAT